LKNVLLASLGAGNNLREATYSFNNASYTTKFCCLGLVRLLDVKFDSLYLLLTKEARKAYENELQKEAAGPVPEIRIIEINSGKTIEEIWQMFDHITESFEQGEEVNVFLDVSNGFRHLPLLSFTSLTYLESSRKVKLAGVYYGAYEARSVGDVTPVFDLTPLVNIVRGSYAVKSFEETGAIEQLGEFLNDLLSMKPGDRKSLYSRLEKLHGAINSGLTIESGIESNELRNWLEKNIPAKCSFKAADELIGRLRARIDKILFSGKEKKAQKQLTMAELERELNFIELQISCNKPDTALLLLREWIVNRVWLAEKPSGSWLKVKDRENYIERILGYWGASTRKKPDDSGNISFSSLAKNWDEITRKRNEFAHAGFRAEVVYPEDANTAARKFLALCQDNILNDNFWQLPRRECNESKVLITGMGSSFGLLYSAIHHIKPDVVVVITSIKYRENALEATKKAGFTSDNALHVIEMQDVFCGFAETPGLIKAIWPLIQNAGSLVVNLTGGTTAMQWVMQSVFEQARSNHLPVKRVAFVDRRPAVKQQEDPWHLGEIIEVDSALLKEKNIE